MNSRKQQLLKRHRQQKRIIIILLVLLLVASEFVMFWLPLVLGILVWIIHETWYSDHLFYSPATDYKYQFDADQYYSLTLTKGVLNLPPDCDISESDSLVLAIHIKAKPVLGRFFDPAVCIHTDNPDRQDFEHSANGVRYINLTGQSRALLQQTLVLKGRYCSLANTAELFVFKNQDYLSKRVMVIAPHADDAELAAYCLYSSAKESWVVTLTAGEIESGSFQQMGLDQASAAKLKGSLRAWDSISIPLWAQVPQERCVQLGYFCMRLKAMQSQPTEPFASLEAGINDVRYFRRFNRVSLASDADGLPTWQNLLQDLQELIERVKPEVIVLPHPSLDPHPDHCAAQEAIKQVLSVTDWQPEALLQYANHSHDNDRWPMGNAGTGVALSPLHECDEAMRLCVLQVSSDKQWEKAMALRMQHDLQSTLSLKQRIRRSLQQVLSGRNWPLFGEDDFFRKTVRRHELFWVNDLPRTKVD